MFPARSSFFFLVGEIYFVPPARPSFFFFGRTNRSLSLLLQYHIIKLLGVETHDLIQLDIKKNFEIIVLTFWTKRNYLRKKSLNKNLRHLQIAAIFLK